ncbi:fungal-specific transcription factor domain-containing protein [Hysterangium stoloniferum]|nr:fungal-specific transcription factor domain-containing protein [Hysterangium stoloniferum]
MAPREETRDRISRNSDGRQSESPPPPNTSSSKQRNSRHSSPPPPPTTDSRRRRLAATSAATPDSSPPSPPSAGRLHHYSLPPLPGMNPNYPPHHSPYLPPQGHYPHHLPGPPPVGTNPPPIPGMYPYGIPHPPPYGHHPYGHHYQYPMGPGGFPHPRHDLPQPSPPDPHSPGSPTTSKPQTKRKRKSEDRTKADDDRDNADLKKRTKTQRACDSCRSRKIRCDVLPDAPTPLCQHCKQYGFDCTFFLPITETRFKKKRLEEEAAAAAAAAAGKLDDPRRADTPKSDPLKGETKVLGPTSAAFLLHSTATVPSRVYENYDIRYHHTWEVSESGDGFIQVTEPARSDSEPAPRFDLRIERDVVERLVNSYFNDIAPYFTVITREEFLSSSPPPPLLLFSICLVAAATRGVPLAIFDTLRNAVATVMKAEDVLSTATTVNLQALLILGMCGDCHSQYVPTALSAFWLRTGTAIRMAQDLGLHRAESVKQNIEVRRRLWAACVITDRWCSLTYGHPYMIDVQDCDVKMVATDKIEEKYMHELLKLSILMGRVLKMIYSPCGLVGATDAGLSELLADLDEWNTHLPPALHFTSAASATYHAGLLRLFYSSVCMLFWRVFMRISYTIPAHLKFSLSIERWTGLVLLTKGAIEWLDKEERAYDVWMLVSYCATSCALVQYHTWVRRQDPEAAASLRQLRDCIKRWESTLPPDHRSTRRKTAEIIALLYESTQTSLPPSSPPSSSPESLNPTVGVRPKGNLPEALKGLMFQKDSSQPGGGVFISTERGSGDYSDLPTGLVVVRGPGEDQGGDENENSNGNGNEAQDVSLSSQPHPQPLVSYTSLSPSTNTYNLNLNPILNTPHVQAHLNRTDQVVTHLEDHAQSQSQSQPQSSQPSSQPHPHGRQAQARALERFTGTDNGLLEGIPGHMFDWEQWETFFARFGTQGAPGGIGGSGAGMAALGEEARYQAMQAAGALAGFGRMGGHHMGGGQGGQGEGK